MYMCIHVHVMQMCMTHQLRHRLRVRMLGAEAQVLLGSVDSRNETLQSLVTGCDLSLSLVGDTIHGRDLLTLLDQKRLFGEMLSSDRIEIRVQQASKCRANRQRTRSGINPSQPLCKEGMGICIVTKITATRATGFTSRWIRPTSHTECMCARALPLRTAGEKTGRSS